MAQRAEIEPKAQESALDLANLSTDAREIVFLGIYDKLKLNTFYEAITHSPDYRKRLSARNNELKELMRVLYESLGDSRPYLHPGDLIQAGLHDWISEEGYLENAAISSNPLQSEDVRREKIIARYFLKKSEEAR